MCLLCHRHSIHVSLGPKVATGWVWGAWAHGPTLVGVKSTFYLHAYVYDDPCRLIV
jgi:hypothetical protein